MSEDPTALFQALEIVERLAVALALGAVIGLDREWHDRPAGLRTHILVSLASALFTMLSFELFLVAQEGSDEAQADPVRVVEAVLTGVAFLGAGTIIRSSRQLEGVTTGASIWLVGAVGVAAGGGFYEIAGIGTAMAILVLTGLGFFERRVRRDRKRVDGGKERPD
jgi:putative Mg2+ transporter-C (MgtC) family protein